MGAKSASSRTGCEKRMMDCRRATLESITDRRAWRMREHAGWWRGVHQHDDRIGPRVSRGSTLAVRAVISKSKGNRTIGEIGPTMLVRCSV